MNPPINNPYYNVGGITESNSFFNRSTNTEFLLNSLFSGPPQCLSIVGQRKIGKTSLALHISRSTTIQDYGFDPGNHLFLYFNCQNRQIALRSVDNFYSELLNCLYSEIPDPLKYIVLSAESKRTYSSLEWENALRELRKKEVYVIVIFDEFEKVIIDEKLIGQGLFGSLRGYAQDNTNFAWITCTSRFLHILFEEAFDEYNISKAQRKSESDFFNIAPSQIVGLFDDSETRNLITLPAQSRQVTFSSEDIEAVIKFSGYFPYFAQRAGYHFFNAYIKGAVQREIILQQCLKEATPLWESYWGKLDNMQQRYLFSIANEQKTEIPLSELETLKDAALIYEDKDGEIQPFSEEFGHFIQGKSNELKSKWQIAHPLDETDKVITKELFPIDIVRGTRDYIERIALQVNGCYKEGWYDACAVMIRRLIETLIIECFEHHNIAANIKSNDGSFLYLRDLIVRFLSETSWSASRNTKASLPKLKDVGDLSAHSRRFVARKGDLDKVSQDIRITIQELVYIAGFDKQETVSKP